MKAKILSISFILMFAFVQFANSAHLNFSSYFSGAQENPPLIINATGTGVYTLTASGGLNYRITVDGLSGSIQAAHFHYGMTGVNGPVVKDITMSVDGNTITGIWRSTDSQPLNDSLIAALMLGKVYVNVHTAANPGGEIRGQINISSGTSLIAKLDGKQERPAVITNAMGTANIILASVGGAGLAYNISVNGLSGPIQGAHFHRGEAGENGPVIKDLTANINGQNIMGVWRTTGPDALTSENIADLLTGKIYINVHTSMHSSGEIRGQLFVSGGFGFSLKLSGMNEVPPVTTPFKGTGHLIFTDYGLIYDITFEGLSGTFGGAHIHDGPLSVNGPVVFDLSSQVMNNNIKGVWKASGMGGDLNASLVEKLFKGELYVNVHSSMHPGGEIRSQILSIGGSGVTASLNGQQEIPSLVSNAKGSMTILANATSLIYDITVSGLSGPITGAHFHLGGIGENGPVVYDITSSFMGGNTASGSIPQAVTDSLRRLLVVQKFYVNIHTASNPGGEIRGQVVLGSGSGMQVLLTGAQEEPAVVTDASGTGSFTLTRGGLGFNISANGLSGPIQGAHFHMGLPGTNGPVVKDITSVVTGNNIAGYWTVQDGQPLNDSLIKALLSGKLYVNLHTAAHPNGEIRGQVMLQEGIGLYAVIDGAQEVPSVMTAAKGTSSYTMTDNGYVFLSTVTGFSSMLMGAHLHLGTAGSNGPVIYDLSNLLTNSNTAHSVWRRTDVMPFNNDVIGNLVNNRVYANFHTMNNANGEIRGQNLTGIVIIVSVQQISSAVPESFTLSQNYPNPFNPATKINFTIPKQEIVKLRVYDLLGKQVAELVSENLNAGSYSIDFNGSDLSSGTYFYRIETPSFNDTKRMILVK